MLVTLAQAGVVVALASALSAALDTTPAPAPAMSGAAIETPQPYPTCIDRFWLEEPAHPCAWPHRTLNPLRAATATATARTGQP